MYRFPNPGSDLGVFTSIFRKIAEVLGTRTFDLDDISKTMVDAGLATSQGAVGKEALARSTRADRTRDPLYNQSKMYAELWRQLGWISSVDSAAHYQVTLAGHGLAAAKDPKPMVLESLLGIAAPSEALEAKNARVLRPFHAILRAMAELDGTLSRDEMIVGPLALTDDRDPEQFRTMVTTLRTARRTRAGIADLVATRSAEWGITPTTMGNYTRFPMAAMQWTGWASGERGKLTLAAAGRNALSHCAELIDFRVGDLRKAAPPVQLSLIRAGLRAMLARASLSTDAIPDEAKDAEVLRKANLDATRMWFSPFQQLPLAQVNTAIQRGNQGISPTLPTKHGPAAETKARPIGRTDVSYTVTAHPGLPDGNAQLTAEIRRHLSNAKGNVTRAIEAFVHDHRKDNRDVFYPLVQGLFIAAGLDCRLSRAGVNYSRHDAILVFDDTSVPIEIKSPGEEPEISVKGVRQALENKIVLLSRKMYPCKRDHASLVVGYNAPNPRSEVHEVVANIHQVYDIRVAVLDLHNLARLAFDAIVAGRKVDVTPLLTATGVVNLAR